MVAELLEYMVVGILSPAIVDLVLRCGTSADIMCDDD